MQVQGIWKNSTTYNIYTTNLWSASFKNFYVVDFIAFEFIPELKKNYDCFAAIYTNLTIDSSIDGKKLIAFCFLTPVSNSGFDLSTYTLPIPGLNFPNADTFKMGTLAIFDPRHMRLRPNSTLLYIPDYTGFYLPWVFDIYSGTFLGNLGRSTGALNGGQLLAFPPSVYAGLSRIVDATTGGVLDNTKVVNSGEAFTFKVLGSTRDGNKFALDSSDVVLEISTIVDMQGQCTGLSFVGALSTSSDGSLIATFTPKLVGVFKIQVTVNDVTRDHVSGSPFYINVIASSTDPSKSTATGSGLDAGRAGSATSFYIYPRDSFGNLRVEDNFEVQVC